jgi:hypothetical protein
MTEADRQEVRQIIHDELSGFMKDGKIVFSKVAQFLDGRNIQFGATTGTKIGTATDQKIAFYGETPVVQAGAIAAPAGGGTAGVDSPARDAINSIRTALANIGIIST